jgi:hypothetical protein|tara:strand:+ start:524 stop:643 length:120 start_codon:yes stop_codon:yes gene_type:complete
LKILNIEKDAIQKIVVGDIEEKFKIFFFIYKKFALKEYF